MVGMDKPHAAEQKILGKSRQMSALNLLLRIELYTQKPLHREATEQLLPTAVFTLRSIYSQKLSDKPAFTQNPFTHKAILKHRSFYTEKPLHRHFYSQTLL